MEGVGDRRRIEGGGKHAHHIGELAVTPLQISTGTRYRIGHFAQSERYQIELLMLAAVQALVVEAHHVERLRIATDNQLDQLARVGSGIEGAGKEIARTGRHHRQRSGGADQTFGGLTDCAVATTGDHQVDTAGTGLTSQIARRAGGGRSGVLPRG